MILAAGRVNAQIRKVNLLILLILSLGGLECNISDE